MFLTKVYFWNIDMEYEWYDWIVTKKEPKMKQIKKLYDGVNLPTDYEIIGKVIQDITRKMIPTGF